jgi:hypothetical protein
VRVEFGPEGTKGVGVVAVGPVHVPADPVRVDPTLAVPVMEGSPVGAGGTVAAITAVVEAVQRVAEPAELVAVTPTRMYLSTSPATGA